MTAKDSLRNQIRGIVTVPVTGRTTMDNFFESVPRAPTQYDVVTADDGFRYTTCERCGSKRFRVFFQNPFYGECKDCTNVEIYPKYPMDDDGNMYKIESPGAKRELIYKKKQPKKTTLDRFL